MELSNLHHAFQTLFLFKPYSTPVKHIQWVIFLLVFQLGKESFREMRHLIPELRLIPKSSDSMPGLLSSAPCRPSRGRSQPNTQGTSVLLMQLSSSAVLSTGHRDSEGTSQSHMAPT